MGLRRRRGRIGVKRILLEVKRLLEVALATDDGELRRNAIIHAFAIAKRARVRVPKLYKLLICRKCLSPLTLSSGARIRTRGGRARKVVVRCGVCGRYKRIPINPRD